MGGGGCSSLISDRGMVCYVFQWGLICDHRHLKAMTQAVYMMGLLVGAVAFGSISDHFGRKISFFTSIGFLVSVGHFLLL